MVFNAALEVGLAMCGPTLLAHAGEEQKKAFLPPLLRGDRRLRGAVQLPAGVVLGEVHLGGERVE